MAEVKILDISKCLVFVLFVVMNCSTGFFIREQSLLTDIKPSLHDEFNKLFDKRREIYENKHTPHFIEKERHWNDLDSPKEKVLDTERKNLLDILQSLQQFNLKNEKDIFDTKPSFKVKSEKQQMDSMADKRDYGIMPPWNEMCRMMRVAFCVRNRRR